jgi:hypothetical protein
MAAVAAVAAVMAVATEAATAVEKAAAVEDSVAEPLAILKKSPRMRAFFSGLFNLGLISSGHLFTLFFGPFGCRLFS